VLAAFPTVGASPPSVTPARCEVARGDEVHGNLDQTISHQHPSSPFLRLQTAFMFSKP